MKKLIFIIIFASYFIQQCGKEQIKAPAAENILRTDRLTMFFKTCESDIRKAVKIISDNKMTANLTHLRLMDDGGRKYYLLERENLSNMILSVTEGTYSDLILINSSGLIIYTMKNDDIFGKHVKHHFIDSPLYNAFLKSENDFYIEDVSLFPDYNGIPVIFAAFPDKAETHTRGIFIIQINTDIISSITGDDIIIGIDGKYRVSKDAENILKEYEFFQYIENYNLIETKKNIFFINTDKYDYFPFNFNSLSWIIISKNKI